MWKKGNLFALLVGMQIGAATVEKRAWNYPKKLKRELLYAPEIPLLGIYLKKPETLI